SPQPAVYGECRRYRHPLDVALACLERQSRASTGGIAIGPQPSSHTLKVPPAAPFIG
ncbi:uncharacterized protein STEHIDRAFT_154360, partial [Stereum hirsutum FP-91666 SS1]|uniref:uncharacterized protein n=1 Tax=Stereum hirsutum (strain FP-91666) TaxID=721885 RepID=UPI000440A2CD